SQPIADAVASHMASATATSVPVAQLALPLLRTTAAACGATSRWRFDTSTGPAHARFWVNVPAAATGLPSAVATSERSGFPDGLMPTWAPAATNPCGAVTDIRGRSRPRAG